MEGCCQRAVLLYNIAHKWQAVGVIERVEVLCDRGLLQGSPEVVNVLAWQLE